MSRWLIRESFVLLKMLVVSVIYHILRHLYEIAYQRRVPVWISILFGVVIGLMFFLENFNERNDGA